MLKKLIRNEEILKYLLLYQGQVKRKKIKLSIKIKA
jgi:hypothetical protein